ncbi:unnamed protein product [Clonostachys rhizophaga]|uniref:non-specific serine/threonine protein kinase n=1 Tax=Clonostachys rhizophaga TaxID=160324 RepID=A0A9N9VFV4_9HYPO|nr:unnamed protein product [Clonostachys rhizophaga]
MSPPEPHHLALFSLVPLNERAERVLAHLSNQHLVSQVKDGRLGLNIGHVRSMSRDNATLATLGRNGDVTVDSCSISKIQCSFEIDPDTKVIMFYDRSHGQTSQVSGDNATPFEYGRPRKAVVQNNVNTIIGMGGTRRNLIQFQLIWHCNPRNTMERVKDRERRILAENPRLARTIDEADTVLPSQRETRITTSGPQRLKTRYDKGERLGSGAFGLVHQALDLDTGKLMAVKIIRRPAGPMQQEWVNLKREVQILSRLKHTHIVEYISSQGWDGPEVEIFMGLKEGTLHSLILSLPSADFHDLATTVLHHMLKAIDCLAMNDIIHRDIKPENILYVSGQDRPHFQLGDFGFSKQAHFATSEVGSPIYMAPEMKQRVKQTHKADVWSLFVTILWTLNVNGFREELDRQDTLEDARSIMLAAAAAPMMNNIREMIIVNPEERASAAQMLVKCFQGEGLSTPQNQIPPLIAPAETDSAAPAAAVHGSSAAQPRAWRRNTNQYPAAGIENARARLRPLNGPRNRRRQALGPNYSVNRAIPGSFPSDATDTSPSKE